MRYFSIVITMFIVVITLFANAAKEETKENLRLKVKAIDPDINIEGLYISPKEKALLDMIEELEARVIELEKK